MKRWIPSAIAAAFCVIGSASANTDQNTALLPLEVRGEMNVTEDVPSIQPEQQDFLLQKGSVFERRNGETYWVFPMVNATIYLRDEGRILMKAEVDSLGHAELILSPRLVDPEIVVATSMGTELHSFSLNALEEVNDRASIRVPVEHNCCRGKHTPHNSKKLLAEDAPGQNSHCCNFSNGSNNSACIDDNGSYAMWKCNNWISSFYDSDCFLAVAWPGYCSLTNDTYCTETRNCSPLIGHSNCWHWWWQTHP